VSEPRYGPERQRYIDELVRRTGRAEVTAVARELGVTPETVRKDLAALEREGRIHRVHGGAIAVGGGPIEPRLAERSERAEQKDRIAAAAVAELRDARSVFIEAGTTTQRAAALLPADRELVVVTNTPIVAVALAPRRELTVLCVGGRVRATTHAAVDDWALRMLQEVHVDVALLGTNGIAPASGLTTPDPSEAAVKRLTLAVGERTLLLADTSKVGRADLCRYGELADVDLLITDRDLDDARASELEEAGLPLRRV
jgi:DeoR family fructose operon transcriptional repressor